MSSSSLGGGVGASGDIGIQLFAEGLGYSIVAGQTTSGELTTKTLIPAQAEFHPFVLNRDIVVSQLGVEITTKSGILNFASIALYSNQTTTGVISDKPFEKLIEAQIDTTVQGRITDTSLNPATVTLKKGIIYWTAVGINTPDVVVRALGFDNIAGLGVNALGLKLTNLILPEFINVLPQTITTETFTDETGTVPCIFLN